MQQNTEFQEAILLALQSKPIYAGTVPAAVKAKRRRRNRAARIARRVHRTVASR